MKIKSLLLIIGIHALVTSCGVRHITPKSGMPCGYSPAAVFNFTLADEASKNLLEINKYPRFFTLNGNQRQYKDQEWDIKSFSSDSSQKYVSAKTIYGFANSSTTFYIEDASGNTNKVEAIIGNNPNDSQCPNAYFYKKVTVNDKDQTASGEVKDQIPYFKLHL